MKNYLFAINEISKVSKKYLFLKLILALINAIATFIGVYALKIVLGIIEDNNYLNGILVINDENKFKILVILIFSIIAFFFIYTNVYHYIESFLTPSVEINVRFNLRKKFLKKIENINLLKYEDNNFYDSYLKAVDVVDNRLISIANSFFGLINVLLSAISILTAILSLDYFIVIISILFVIAITCSNMTISKRRNEFYEKTFKNNREVGYYADVFYQKRYSKEFREYELENLMLPKFEDKTKEILKLSNKLNKKNLPLFSINNFLKESFQFVVLLYLVICIFYRDMPISSVATLLSASTLFNSKLIGIVNFFSSSKQHSYFIGNYINFNNMIEEENKNNKDLIEENVFHDLVLENVSFSYPNSPINVIKNMNLKICDNDKIGIVGINGAGKTTLTRLLTGEFETNEGNVFLNGININKYSQKSLNNLFGIVNQDFNIYQWSIIENITMKPYDENDIEIVNNILKKVGLYDYVYSLKNNIYTPLGKMFDDEGTEFSGGQKQKIAIARALYKNAEVLIMDEPSSALDPKSEYEINQLILDIAKRKTIIIISHRLSTVTKLDKVLFIENGEKILFDSHYELMKYNNKYSSLFKMQSESYKD